jgi:hypothetical protein
MPYQIDLSAIPLEEYRELLKCQRLLPGADCFGRT